MEALTTVSCRTRFIAPEGGTQMSQPADPMEGLPHPALKAMLICERAIREAGTGKVTLVGIFDNISSTAFPFDFVGGLAVYARLTDAQGRYPIRLELVRLADEQAIGRAIVEAEILDRMGSHEVTFNIGHVRFDRPGRYEFRLFANERFGGAIVLDVIQERQENADG